MTPASGGYGHRVTTRLRLPHLAGASCNRSALLIEPWVSGVARFMHMQAKGKLTSGEAIGVSPATCIQGFLGPGGVSWRSQRPSRIRILRASPVFGKQSVRHIRRHDSRSRCPTSWLSSRFRWEELAISSPPPVGSPAQDIRCQVARSQSGYGAHEHQGSVPLQAPPGASSVLLQRGCAAPFASS